MDIKKIIEQVEKFIPFNLRKNFYKNLKNLTIEYIGTVDLNCAYNEEFNGSLSAYDYKTNTIEVNLNAINNAVANVEKNKKQKYEELFRHALIHELLHMASTNYKKLKPTKTGLGYIDACNEDITLIGITEGYTELLASEIEKENITFLKNNPYVYQILLSKQIEIIVGKSVMTESYFTESADKLIKKRLKKINSDLPVETLLELISSTLYEQYDEDSLYFILCEIQKKLKELCKIKYLNQELSDKELEEFKSYIIDKNLYYIDKNAAELVKTYKRV